MNLTIETCGGRTHNRQKSLVPGGTVPFELERHGNIKYPIRCTTGEHHPVRRFSCSYTGFERYASSFFRVGLSCDRQALGTIGPRHHRRDIRNWQEVSSMTVTCLKFEDRQILMQIRDVSFRPTRQLPWTLTAHGGDTELNRAVLSWYNTIIFICPPSLARTKAIKALNGDSCCRIPGGTHS